MKTVVQLDANGYFIGTTTADESPKEPGVYLMPAKSIDADIPTIPNGMRAKWNNEWIFENIPEPEPEPEPPDPFEGIPEYELNRSREYPSLYDYLDGVVKGDQTQIDKYIADCLAIKAKYPKE
jgi:hypothetical protein